MISSTESDCDLSDVFSLVRRESLTLPLATVFERRYGESALCYFGASHSNDPEHPQFEPLRAALNRFQPDAVVIEALYEYTSLVEPERFQKLKNWYLQRSEEEIIRVALESGVPLLYAFRHDAFIWCPEMTFPVTLEFFVDEMGFDIHESVAFSAILRRLYSVDLQSEAWETTFRNDLHQLAKETRREGQFDIDSVRSAFTRLTGRKLEELNRKELSSLLESYTGHPFEKFANSSGVRREERILTSIYNLLRRHKRVFVLYGKGHLAGTREALEKMGERF